MLACHDLSDGGLAVAVAEMAIGGGLGARLMLADVPFDADASLPAARRDLAIAFGESPGRFLCEVPAGGGDDFAAAIGDVPWSFVGEVLARPVVELVGTPGDVGQITVAELAAAWRTLSREAS